MFFSFFFKEESSYILVPFRICFTHFHSFDYCLVLFYVCLFNYVSLYMSLRICKMLCLQLIKISEGMR